MREQIAQRELELHQAYYHNKYGYHKWGELPPIMQVELYEKADGFLSLFKEQIEKMGVLSDEEVTRQDWPVSVRSVDNIRVGVTRLELFRLCKEEGFIDDQLAKCKDALRGCE